jgi:2,3,4,5-tetrahydropyridine-2-carboxylate N-succinyltransferase
MRLLIAAPLLLLCACNVDRDAGTITQGEVPPYSVVVPGTLAGKNGGPGLYCAVIVKRVDERTRSKTSINELLRD